MALAKHSTSPKSQEDFTRRHMFMALPAAFAGTAALDTGGRGRTDHSGSLEAFADGYTKGRDDVIDFLERYLLGAKPSMRQMKTVTVDPVAEAYSDWIAARQNGRAAARVPGNGNFDSPASLKAMQQEIAAEGRMLDAVPVSLDGIAGLTALIWSLTWSGALGPTEKEQEFAHPTFKALRAIWRACGKEGEPLL